MKKKTIQILIVILTLALLVPIPLKLKDGGSVRYQAVLYSVTDVHRLDLTSKTGYQDGMSVEILGFEIYSSTECS